MSLSRPDGDCLAERVRARLTWAGSRDAGLCGRLPLACVLRAARSPSRDLEPKEYIRTAP